MHASLPTVPSTTSYAVLAEQAFQVWDAEHRDGLELSSTPGIVATLRPDRELRTPAGSPTLAVSVAASAAAGEARLSVAALLAVPSASSYELRFLCRAATPGTLRIERPAGATLEVETTRCWQEIAVVVPASAQAASPLVTLVLAGSATGTVLHLGPLSAWARQPCAIPETGWSLFQGANPPASLVAIPAVLGGPHGEVRARVVSFRQGKLELEAPAGGFRERDSAMLWNTVESPRAGLLRVGVSADWWLQIWCNGAPVFSTLAGGNGTARFQPQDHVVEIPLRAGTNLLAVQLLSGSRGWLLVLGALELACRSATPRGEVIQGEFAASAIYPGTTRAYWVYIPRQYDAARPACVHVSQDGHRQQFTDTMDQLIDGQEMPVTVGIFISPGTMPAPSPAVAARSNRCYEYDSLGDDFARFLLEEMLPFVARTHGLNLSAAGDDRSIGGCSSGGICAFNVAWERPDAFRRVYTNSGSFVAFRGGDILPQLLRKHEAKPIRVFTHVATHDMENSGGNWWFANQEFERSLVFANYEHQYRWSTGGHGDRYLEAFPEAMRWLWRDYPAPVTAGLGPPRTQDLLRPGEHWSPVDAQLTAIGALAACRDGAIIASEAAGDRLWRIGSDGRVSVWAEHAGQLSGLTGGADGSIYGVSAATGRVLAFDEAGRSRVIAQGVPGVAIAADRAGGCYVTGQLEGVGRVWRVESDGAVRLVDSGLRAATAVALSIDGWVLYVADGASHFVHAYHIRPDGSLANRERLVWLHVPDNADDSGATALSCSAPANVLLIATRLGIQSADKEGHNQCIIPSPQGRMTALCLGGEGFTTLFASCAGRLFRRQVKVAGVHAFHPIAPIAGHGL
jgi:gluconolactonase